MSRDHRKPSRYNQQFFRDWGGVGPLVVGLFAILLVVLGFYFAFAKSIPFTSPGYQVNATFTNAVNIAINSPVRIAGINVGKVTDLEPNGNNTTVTFTVDENGRPLREDAAAQIRPRLFLEGNWFIDLDPGTPEEPEMPDEGTIPVSRTATSVQFGDILRNTLQLPQRANLQKVFDGLGTGLNAKPTAGEDLTFEPSVRGLSGGEALNLLYRKGERAARGTAIVNAAYLGENPNELSSLLRGLGRLTGTVNERADDVQGFVTNFATFTGALAAESENLSATIRELPPTLTTARTSLDSLNRALPALRGFALAITPGSQRDSPDHQEGHAAHRPAQAAAHRARTARPDPDHQAQLTRLDHIGPADAPAPAAAPELRTLRGRQRRTDRRPGDHRRWSRQRPEGLEAVALRGDRLRRRHPDLRRQRTLREVPDRRRRSQRADGRPAGRRHPHTALRSYSDSDHRNQSA